MSTEPNQTFQIQFLNSFEALARATESAMQFLAQAQASAGAVNVANLALEEMATNIVKYGYDDQDAHEILLRLALVPGAIVLTLEDDGHPFDPLRAPEPNIHLPLEEREPGGLGIHLIRKMAQRMVYERSGGRNRLTITIQA
jgi:anti-sigma regulatory factor (Ser/Thr protein kinase)